MRRNTIVRYRDGAGEPADAVSIFFALKRKTKVAIGRSLVKSQASIWFVVVILQRHPNFIFIRREVILLFGF